MTLPNVETHFSEIFCCAEAELFSSKTSEAKLKLPCKYGEKIHTLGERGVVYVYPLSSSTSGNI